MVYGEQQIYLNLWSVNIFSHFGRTRESARYAGWMSFRVWKVIVVEELVPVEPLFKELVQPIILTKSDCILY